MVTPPFQKKFLEQHGSSETYLTEKLVLAVQTELIGRMRELGFTQEQLAQKLGVSQPNISKMLNKEENMTLKTIATLARALGAEWEQPKLRNLDTTANVVPLSSQKGRKADQSRDSAIAGAGEAPAKYVAGRPKSGQKKRNTGKY